MPQSAIDGRDVEDGRVGYQRGMKYATGQLDSLIQGVCRARGVPAVAFGHEVLAPPFAEGRPRSFLCVPDGVRHQPTAGDPAAPATKEDISA